MTILKSKLRALTLGALSLALSFEVTAGATTIDEKPAFVINDGRDLRALADAKTRGLLKRARGVGARFGSRQKTRYCKLKNSNAEIQWAVNDLKTGKVIAHSRNAQQLYFGASVAKLFVAAAFLDKKNGKFSQKQLRELVRMIVISDNPAWKSLQRQTGGSKSNYAGRVAVQAFVERMGYPTIQGFQGWIKHKNGKREHGNELNALELASFLHDTYQQKYPGSDVLWEIMRATRTGNSKIGKYTPSQLFIGGKTGTYDGPNESRSTVRLARIGARNHAVVLFADRGIFGISVLANTSSNEDVAIVGGGLMREYLGVKPSVKC